jgi:hypothetical protein
MRLETHGIFFDLTSWSEWSHRILEKNQQDQLFDDRQKAVFTIYPLVKDESINKIWCKYETMV